MPIFSPVGNRFEQELLEEPLRYADGASRCYGATVVAESKLAAFRCPRRIGTAPRYPLLRCALLLGTLRLLIGARRLLIGGVASQPQRPQARSLFPHRPQFGLVFGHSLLGLARLLLLFEQRLGATARLVDSHVQLLAKAQQNIEAFRPETARIGG